MSALSSFHVPELCAQQLPCQEEPGPLFVTLEPALDVGCLGSPQSLGEGLQHDRSGGRRAGLDAVRGDAEGGERDLARGACDVHANLYVLAFPVNERGRHVLVPVPIAVVHRDLDRLRYRLVERAVGDVVYCAEGEQAVLAPPIGEVHIGSRIVLDVELERRLPLKLL
jgi:hypothetical protein